MPLEQSSHDRAIHNNTRRAILRSARTGDKPRIDVQENVKLTAQPVANAASNRFLRPFADIHISQRAVVRGNRRNAAQDVKRPTPIDQAAILPLALRVIAAQRPIDKGKQPLDRTKSTVVVAYENIT